MLKLWQKITITPQPRVFKASVSNDCKQRSSGFCTVTWTEEAIWRCHFGPWSCDILLLIFYWFNNWAIILTTCNLPIMTTNKWILTLGLQVCLINSESVYLVCSSSMVLKGNVWNHTWLSKTSYVQKAHASMDRINNLSASTIQQKMSSSADNTMMQNEHIWILIDSKINAVIVCGINVVWIGPWKPLKSLWMIKTANGLNLYHDFSVP